MHCVVLFVSRNRGDKLGIKHVTALPIAMMREAEHTLRTIRICVALPPDAAMIRYRASLLISRELHETATPGEWSLPPLYSRDAAASATEQTTVLYQAFDIISQLSDHTIVTTAEDKRFSKVDVALLSGIHSIVVRSHPLLQNVFAMLDVAARGVAREREADEILAACFRRVAGVGIQEANGWIHPSSVEAAFDFIEWLKNEYIDGGFYFLHFTEQDARWAILN